MYKRYLKSNYVTYKKWNKWKIQWKSSSKKIKYSIMIISIKKLNSLIWKKNLSIFPIKFFILYKEEQNMFILEELKDDTNLIIRPNYPVVIYCLNEIFQEC